MIRENLRELTTLFQLLFREFSWTRKAAPAAALLLLIGLCCLLRPASPIRTVEMYVNALHKGRCARAYALLARERVQEDLNFETQEKFDRRVCRRVQGEFDKLFLEKGREIKVRAGRRLFLDFCLCSRSAGSVRRVCSVHEATLVRDPIKWKILSLDIGPWDTHCDFLREKHERLVNPNSKNK